MHVPLILIPIVVIIALIAFWVFKSLLIIGPTQIGLVNKRFGKRLSDGNIIAMNGEAGFQAELLMPGLRLKLWPIYSVEKHPWVQVPADEIGVVIAQVGAPLDVGAKSGVYHKEFGDFRDLRAFLDNGGQKGVQRPVLPPGSLIPIHPVGFLVKTSERPYGVSVSATDRPRRGEIEGFDEAPHINRSSFRVVNIIPDGSTGMDQMGIVTVLEGKPLEKGDIASRLGGYADISEMEADGKKPEEIIGALFGTKNELHNNYQDFQAFLDQGGRIGLQHDPLLYGAYLLNPYLVKVEIVPMTLVEQGEVAVIKSYVGLETEDTSGEEFKFGTIVSPGHRGIWSEVLRTGKYPINPRCYSAEIVPTSILTLNWAKATSDAHELDRSLSAIDAKSKEGFEFSIDLQGLIHVPDTKAARVISAVGTMQNLVNEVLQSAVGNYFRNKLQGLEAVKFIETREQVQKDAEEYIKEYLEKYDVEVRGVYIQDVVLPSELVEVLKKREIANQNKTTYEQEKSAQDTRKELENAKGTADAQAALAKSKVEIEVKQNEAEAKEAQAKGEASYTEQTGKAKAEVVKVTGEAEGEAVKAVGLGRAAGFEAQKDAIGSDATAAVAVFGEIGKGHVKVVPDVLVNGGDSVGGLAASGIPYLAKLGGVWNGDANQPKPSADSAAPDSPDDDQALAAPAIPGVDGNEVEVPARASTSDDDQ